MNDGSIVDSLEAAIGIEGKPRALRSAIESVLRDAGLSELKAIAKADRRLNAVRSIIENRREVADADGLISTLDLYGSMRNSVGGSSYELGTDDPGTKKIKKGRAAHKAILSEIRNLTPLEFERFGAALIRSLGAQRAESTIASGDQGIDFRGTVKLSDLLDHPKRFFKLAADVRVDFLGQAKHYPKSKLGPSAVREMVGSLELARSRNFSSERFTSLDDLALTPFGPVLAMLITTGPVTDGARKVAKSSGVMLKSGDQLATYLADLGVGLDEDGDFDVDRFRSWIEPSSD